MSIVSATAPASKPNAIPTTPIAAAWQANAPKLAVWTIQHLVNRVDAWGSYLPLESRTPKKKSITVKAGKNGQLTAAKLERHYRGRLPEHVVGLHAIGQDNQSRWVKNDYDAHVDGEKAPNLASDNFARALESGHRAIAVGLHPILSDSNSKGGYHLETIFSSPIPSDRAFWFARWLARGRVVPDGKAFQEVETFPKQPNVNASRPYGNWIRVHGRHHTKNHWEKVWHWTEERWLEGQGAIDYILEHTGDDPKLLEAVDFMPPAVPMAPLGNRGPKPGDAVERCYEAIVRLPTKINATGWARIFAAACLCVEYDLTPPESLDVLRRHVAAGGFPIEWTDADFQENLDDAEKHTQRGKKNRPYREKHVQRARPADDFDLADVGFDFPAGVEKPDTLRIGCGLVADTCACPNSSYCAEEGSSQKRDSANNPQGIRKVYEKYLHPPEPMEPWSCPHVIGIAGELRGSPCLIPAPCHKRDCPVCGPYWRDCMMHRFATHLDGHDGELYYEVVPDIDWPVVVKDMRRRAKKLGVELRYVAIRDDQNCLNIVASVPVLASIARPIEKAEALKFIRQAFESASPDPRPVLNCRAWGPIDGDLEAEEKASRVPGGSTPKAYTATVKAWGSDVADAKGAVLKCKHDGLFLRSDGQLDAARQADFWREAQLYDTCGPQAAADFHRTAAARRLGNCRHVNTMALNLYNGKAAVWCHDCERCIGTKRAGP
jgi:hypothetical protein